LKYSLLVTMDGNNSLKLVDATFRAGTPWKDDHILPSPRWLTPEQVDVFKDEVAKSAPAKVLYSLLQY
jgi:nucleoid-associated protein YgaU